MGISVQKAVGAVWDKREFTEKTLTVRHWLLMETVRTSASDLITQPNPRDPVGEKLGRNLITYRVIFLLLKMVYSKNTMDGNV